MSWVVVAAAEAGIVALALVALAGCYRIFKGPSPPDRMVALDTLTTGMVGIGALKAISSGREFYLLISLVLGIIGFISTVTVAKFVEEGDIIV